MKQSIVVYKLSLTQIICTQIYLALGDCNCQNLALNQQLPNGNILLNGNTPTNNLASMPTESNVKVNGLRIITTLPLVDGFFNSDKPTNVLPHSDVFQISNDLPTGNLQGNNAAMLNNILPNNLAAGSLPSLSPSNFQLSNTPVTNPLATNPPQNLLSLGNNLAINGLSLSNKVLNNELLSNGVLAANGAVFNSAVPNNIAGIASLQNLNNFANNGPKMARNLLPNGISTRTGLPTPNVLENNFRQTPGPINTEIQLANMLANNGPLNNGFPVNGLSVTNGFLSPQVGNNIPLPIPAPVPFNDFPPNNGQFNLFGNLNRVQSGNVLTASVMSTNSLPVVNTPNVPNTNFQNLQNLLNQASRVANVPGNHPVLPVVNTAPNVPQTPSCQNVLQNGLSFLASLPVGNLQIGNLPVGNLPVPNLPVTNLQTENSIISAIGQNQLLSNNILSNLNLLNLGDSGRFPILSGLPIIGITESITVLNPL